MMIYLIVFSTVAGAMGLVVFILLMMQYRSLQAWRIDHNVDLKKGTTLTAVEVMELLQKSRPLPVDTLQGWTLYSFDNGTRIWWHNFTISGASITVFASFGGVAVSSMTVFQVLKDISHTWSWKPGVMSTSYILRGSSKQKADPRSSPSLSSSTYSSKSANYDVIAEEHLKSVSDGSKSYSIPCHLPITDTETVTLQRYWDCDNSGGGWLLESNEKTGDWKVYIFQPLKDTFQCLITILVHEKLQSPIATAAITSRLLGSLQNFFLYKKVNPPTFPYVLFHVDNHRMFMQRSASFRRSGHSKDTRFFNRFRSLLEKKPSVNSKMILSKEDRQKTEDILRPLTFPSEDLMASCLEDSTHSLTSSSASSGSVKSSKDTLDSQNKLTDPDKDSVSEDEVESKTNGHAVSGSLPRSASVPEGGYNIPTNSPKDHRFVFYQTVANEAAATLLKELTLSSNIDLQSQTENNNLTGRWVFCGLDDEIVILRKIPEEGSSLQSYMGKGIVQVPPKVVWDTVRNPRTKFTYDESLKKVDVLESFLESLKIVYFYHEVVALFRKDCCDACVVLSERLENNRFILSMQSVDYENTRRDKDATKAIIKPSGWIIEPLVKDNRLCSMVTYIMQMDFGPPKTATDRYPFEDLVIRQPLSIADLRRYLRSAVVWARHHTSPARS
ncbi:uncharacterized protein LOC106881316 [Octopus bimaculoides]|uniref:START domain-containing protein n=1 Tax=Octopus bimaculoides TaxID=37653 RepID=A0A0L8FT63_OCTBM|nr:uncharacterized protein LOC106881316 [Octopus bimaculoides]|eukprot:XP_014787146.1 PREDICTED: uncharacterized protein LOC106881316 [Octopus bimaculoides]